MFSVVIPTLNRGPKLLRAVRSVLAQTLMDFEILVIDDGTDDCAALIRQAFGHDVRYLRGSGKGVAAGRNLGIAEARGDYLAFLDADDWWYPGKLQRVADAARAYPEVALFYSKMDAVGAEGNRIRTPPIKEVGRAAYPGIVAGNFIFNSTAVVKRAILERVGGFDTTLCGCEDWELWIRVTRHAPSMLIPEALVAYEHLSEGSLTSRYETWIRAHDEVIVKTLAADPTLTSRQLDDIHAGLLYTKASIYLGAGEEELAREHFRQVVSQRWTHWRALVYVVVLSWMALRRSLPNRLKVLLRLPEAHR